MTSTDAGYAPGGASASSVDSGPAPDGYWSLEKCKKAYLDYLGTKTQEIEEQKSSRRYYHGAQWTDKQRKVMRERNQPVATRNRINRKIDGTIGLLERLRQEPKAYPRTPKQEGGADLATASIRYVLDGQNWKAKSPEASRDASIDGFGGVAIEIEQGDHGDPDVGFDVVEPDSFFYDPRSYRMDFSDARYMGEGKWVDADVLSEMFEDADFGEAGNDGTDLTSNPDREKRWFSFDGSRRLIRLVEIWYQHKGGWCWAVFTGSKKLKEGKSYLFDEKRKPMCRYIMFTCNIDHDGDRYGFVRNMQSSQDSLNFKHSKLDHIMASRRLIMVEGAVTDIEKARKEWAKADGVIMLPPGTKVGESIKTDDQSFDFTGLMRLLEDDKQELDNYGPNQALIGDIQNQSGRAIQLLQQAGMAELGPFVAAWKDWKVRVYRAVFSTVQQYWTAERWIRVTDDEGLEQYVRVNGVQRDPMTGMPTMVNALGSLDVDIILDEGPDTINAQQDVYETMGQVLPAIGPMLQPPQAQAAVEILVDNSQLSAQAKKRFRDASQPQTPDPMQQRAKMVALAGEEAKVRETDSKVALNMSKAQEAMAPDAPAAPKQQSYELPPELQNLQALADIRDTNASADQKQAQARKANVDAMLAPQQSEHQQRMDAANFHQAAAERAEAHAGAS